MMKCSKQFVTKAANEIKLLVNVLNILLCCRQDSWKTLLEELYLVTLLVYCCTFIPLHVDSFVFNMFENFGRIVFQAALVRCFFKERILTKQERNCNNCAFQTFLISRNIKAGNIILTMMRSRLEQAGSSLPGTEWKTSRLHINVTNLWKTLSFIK